MFVMRYTAGFLVYLLLGLSIAACLTLGIYLVCVPNDSYVGISVNRVLVMIIGIVLIVFSLLLAIIFSCYAKRIKLAAIIV
jgi:hypothetical protein